MESALNFRFEFIAILSAVLVLGAATAHADVGGTQPGEVPPETFADADTCGQCHGGGIDGDYSFLPADTSGGSMMANSARDPVFLAALTIANQDVPDSGTHCLHCHAPAGFVRGHATPSDGSQLDAIDQQGVGCDVCHRATQSTGADAPYLLGNAQLVFTPDKIKHGPYAGATSPVHDTVQDTGLADPRFCGQCHFVTNPLRRMRDANGVETPYEFPLDTTYLEWADSAYADIASEDYASCQDCHMKRKLGMFPVSDGPDAPPRENPRRHEFVGGNVWGIDAVMAANPERATMFPRAFSNARSKSEEILHNAVVLTILEAPARVRAGDMLEVKARIENRAGHKFPTGYTESRRAWVSLMLVNADFVKYPLVGAYDTETGEIATDPPTHVYQARHGRFDGMAKSNDGHIVESDMILSDTRIPPKGFVAVETTQPTSEIDYSDGMGGLQNTDEVTLRAKVPTELLGHHALVVQVQYQSMTREHVEMLARDNVTDTRGEDLLTLYEATGAAGPIAAATSMQGIEVDPLSSGDVEDQGACSIVVPSRGVTSNDGMWFVLVVLLAMRKRRGGAKSVWRSRS